MPYDEILRNVALTLSRSAAFIANAFLFGLVALLLLVLRPAAASIPEGWERGRARVARRLEGLMQASITGAALATFVILVLQTVLVSEASGGEVGSRSVFAALGTRFGQLYLLRFPLLAGLAILLAGRVKEWSLAGVSTGHSAPGKGWWAGWLVLSAGLLATSSLSGHATVATPQPWPVVVDLVHLMCGSIWVSGVIVLAAVLPEGWRGAPKQTRVAVLAPTVTRFSTVALITFSLLGITGTISSFMHVGALSDLTSTGYGRALLAKITVYVVVLALGAFNHFYIRDRLQRGAPDATSAARYFRRSIAAELALALVVMGLTGLLTGLARTKETPVQPRRGEVVSAPR